MSNNIKEIAARCTDVNQNFIAYFRVSTGRQGRSGLGLDAQRAAVMEYVTRTGGRLIEEFVEVESGASSSRPKMVEALRLCRVTSATLIIAKLDRLARNVAFISGLLEAGVDFLAVDMPFANKLTVHILAAVAEHERQMISERTTAALRAAKARGVRLGGDRGHLRQVAAVGALASSIARRQRAESLAADLAPLIRRWREDGHSLREVGRLLDKRGIRAPRGGEWSAAQISRTLARAEG